MKFWYIFLTIRNQLKFVTYRELIDAYMIVSSNFWSSEISLRPNITDRLTDLRHLSLTAYNIAVKQTNQYTWTPINPPPPSSPPPPSPLNNNSSLQWWWLSLRLLKHQSLLPTTVPLRTTLTWYITSGFNLLNVIYTRIYIYIDIFILIIVYPCGRMLNAFAERGISESWTNQ